MSKPELLSPAGSYASLTAAVNAGADAVYLGASAFGARAGAVNFSNEEMKNALSYCHMRNTKAYLTLNTLIGDAQMHDALVLADQMAQMGIDAFIVQDIGLFSLLQKNFPEIPLHISTQAFIHNTQSAQFFMQKGASRIVLARECSLSEIRSIYEATGAEIEAFVHGALCISRSGQCLMSSFIGGDSGNRGRCRQPCRKTYNGKYLLSPRDLCLISHLEDLKEAGVASFKIEGRMKGPSYVGLVTAMYRKAIDGEPITEEMLYNLHGIFCRGDSFTEGYYSEKTATHIVPGNISGENIYQKQSEHARKTAEKILSVEKKIPIEMIFQTNEIEASLTVKKDNTAETVQMPLSSDMSPIPEERLTQQLQKLGSTPFYSQSTTILLDAPCCLPISSINQMRRDACSGLENQLQSENSRPPKEIRLPHIVAKKQSEPMILSCITRTAAQEKALLSVGANVYRNHAEEGCVYLSPGYVPVAKESRIKEQMQKCSAVVVNNHGTLQMAREASVPYIAGFRMNIFNRYAIESFYDAIRITASPELTLRQIKDIARHFPTEAILYGRIPLMLLGLCLSRNQKFFSACPDGHAFKDETGATFPVYGNCAQDGCVLYNSRPLFLADKKDAWQSIGLSGGVLLFTDESPAECVRIFHMYEGREEAVLPPLFTRGHAFHGVN